MKIVINRCYGGFGMSNKALKMIYARKGQELLFYRPDYETKLYIKIQATDPQEDISFMISQAFTKDFGNTVTFEEVNKAGNAVFISAYDFNRADEDLVAIVEELGKGAGGSFSDLHIVEIPDDVDWEIDEYDGMETIKEAHRKWS